MTYASFWEAYAKQNGNIKQRTPFAPGLAVLTCSSTCKTSVYQGFAFHTSKRYYLKDVLMIKVKHMRKLLYFFNLRIEFTYCEGQIFGFAYMNEYACILVISIRLLPTPEWNHSRRNNGAPG